MRMIRQFALCLSMAMVACSSQSTPPGAQAHDAGVSAGHDPQTADAGELSTLGTLDTQILGGLLPDGAKLIDSVIGDLTGRDLQEGVLVVEDTGDTTERALGNGPARTVILLTRDASGALREAARNDRIVPCARCGGMAGDPYGFTRVDAGELTISVSGGSRERWFADYVFHYEPTHAQWMLDRVARGVTDTQTDLGERQALTRSDLGEIGFASFDPQGLPEAPTLD